MSEREIELELIGEELGEGWIHINKEQKLR